jgi:xanthine dehydrogenase iron-sulfur cluster and FAD-binding subunit A
VDISFPALKPNQTGTFIKYALRQAQAISLVNIAIILSRVLDGCIDSAIITYGAVAPVIIHAVKAEEFLVGKKLNEETILKAAVLASEDARPISDVRSSARYRKTIARVICKRGLQAIAEEKERVGFPQAPVLLRGNQITTNAHSHKVFNDTSSTISATVNGRKMEFQNGYQKTLLRLLREDGLLIGTKEGCSEGECGACTVFMDGEAVMSCMVPAPRAHGANIVTVEGLSVEGQLHPVQQAFIQQGAVQCGYCTPGFIMSAVKLLEEKPTPGEADIKQALSGNLCRCTGYYKIIQAIEMAANQGGD